MADDHAIPERSMELLSALSHNELFKKMARTVTDKKAREEFIQQGEVVVEGIKNFGVNAANALDISEEERNSILAAFNRDKDFKEGVEKINNAIKNRFKSEKERRAFLRKHASLRALKIALNLLPISKELKEILKYLPDIVDTIPKLLDGIRKVVIGAVRTVYKYIKSQISLFKNIFNAKDMEEDSSAFVARCAEEFSEDAPTDAAELDYEEETMVDDDEAELDDHKSYDAPIIEPDKDDAPVAESVESDVHEYEPPKPVDDPAKAALMAAIRNRGKTDAAPKKRSAPDSSRQQSMQDPELLAGLAKIRNVVEYDDDEDDYDLDFDLGDELVDDSTPAAAPAEPRPTRASLLAGITGFDRSKLRKKNATKNNPTTSKPKSAISPDGLRAAKSKLKKGSAEPSAAKHGEEKPHGLQSELSAALERMRNRNKGR